MSPAPLGERPDGWTRIEFDDVPESINAFMRLHFGERKRLREKWAWRLKLALMRLGYDLSLEAPKMSVNFTIHRPRRLDRDNNWGACKVIVDAMRDINFIRNDSEVWLDEGVSQMIGPERTVIEFRETAPTPERSGESK